jgi:hypothetical protein
MTEPRNAGLWYAHSYITLDRHHQRGGRGGSSGALESGDPGEAPSIGEPEPIAPPRLYQIAHSPDFYKAATQISKRPQGAQPSRQVSNFVQTTGTNWTHNAGLDATLCVPARGFLYAGVKTEH